jgi:predicted dienelactone hydrolase
MMAQRAKLKISPFMRSSHVSKLFGAKAMKWRLHVILLTCAVLAAALPANVADAQVGLTQEEKRDFRVVDFDWVDDSRARPVPARLYWPANVSSGRVPLIVFSHGMGGSRRGYTYLATRWATHGVASLHVQHVGSDSTVWRGNPFGVVDRLQAAAHDNEAAARVGDLRFALDRILSKTGGSYAALVDRRRIVAAGHSYGANTTLLAVGARVVREGRWREFRDPRYSAAIVISAPPFYGEVDLTGVLAKVTVPTLHVTATDDVIRIPGYFSPATDRAAIFGAVPKSRKLLAVFRGGSHSMFTDRAFTGGLELNPKVKEATADLALAFLDYTFEDDVSGLTRWSLAWRDILAELPAPTATPAATTAGRKAFGGQR